MSLNTRPGGLERYLLYGILAAALIGWAVYSDRPGNQPIDLAVRALESRKTDEAIRQFDLSIKGRKENPNTYRVICADCGSFQRWDLVQRYAREGIQNCKYASDSQGRAQLYVSLSEALAETEPHPQECAIENAERALQLDPHGYICLNLLGYLLADNDRDYPRAEAYLREALLKVGKEPPSDEQRAVSATIMDSFGWVLFKEGHALTAADALTQAINEGPEELSNSPEMKVIYYHLGAAYRLAGKPEPARNAFEKALHLDPTFQPANAELAALPKQTSLPPSSASTSGPRTGR